MQSRTTGRAEVTTAVAALTVFVLMVCVGATADIGKLASARAAMQNAAEMAALAAAHVSRQLPAQETQLVAAAHFRDNLTGGAGTVPVEFVGHLGRSSAGSGRGGMYSCGPFLVKVWHPYEDKHTQALGLDPQKLICVEAELWAYASLLGRTKEKIKIAQARAVATVGADSLENRAVVAHRTWWPETRGARG